MDEDRVGLVDIRRSRPTKPLSATARVPDTSDFIHISTTPERLKRSFCALAESKGYDGAAARAFFEKRVRVAFVNELDAIGRVSTEPDDDGVFDLRFCLDNLVGKAHRWRDVGAGQVGGDQPLDLPNYSKLPPEGKKMPSRRSPRASWFTNSTT